MRLWVCACMLNSGGSIYDVFQTSRDSHSVCAESNQLILLVPENIRAYKAYCSVPLVKVSDMCPSANRMSRPTLLSANDQEGLTSIFAPRIASVT
jgi:hypothetical protein